MFDLDAVSLLHPRALRRRALARRGGRHLGLVLVVFGSLRSGRPETVAFAVGGYITAAYWFTSSTSFANPAVTVARMLSDTFAGIAPASVPMFVLMQLVGGVLALGLVRFLFAAPDPGGGPHDEPTVLFVCVHNAGRSQMAAGYLQHLAGDRVDVRLRRLAARRPDQPGRGRGDGRGGHRHHRRAAEGADPRRGAGLRRRRHDGLRRRVPVLPGQALRGLGPRRPGRSGHRGRPADPRRDPSPGRAAGRRAGRPSR